MKPTKPIKPDLINYIGPSMNPTLRAGDGLKIIPYDGQSIRLGDVVVFIPPGDENKIVHRVVSVGCQGIRTRGDNNNHMDPWILRPDNVVGRVVCAQRRNRRLRIFGGFMGRLFLVAVRTIHLADSAISSLLRPVYHWVAPLISKDYSTGLARRGVFRRLMHKLVAPRIVSFNRPEGIALQVLMGRRVIGWLPAGKENWHIRRPFRLFVDEQSLPRNLPESGFPTQKEGMVS
jgi:hypothetical protein